MGGHGIIGVGSVQWSTDSAPKGDTRHRTPAIARSDKAPFDTLAEEEGYEMLDYERDRGIGTGGRELSLK